MSCSVELCMKNNITSGPVFKSANLDVTVYGLV